MWKDLGRQELGEDAGFLEIGVQKKRTWEGKPIAWEQTRGSPCLGEAHKRGCGVASGSSPCLGQSGQTESSGKTETKGAP
jgi:hypothetical protein